MDNKIQKEKDFHNARFGGTDPRKSVGKFYAVKRHANDYFKNSITKRCNGKQLLEYGCGFGNTSFDYINAGANLTGIDISAEGIKRARKSASNAGVDAKYLAMNAEEMDFENNVFDICVGSGILHHLDLEKSLSEIARVLKKDGSAIFIEPMGHNPVINWYRNRTPSMRTDDERPLLKSDFELTRERFEHVEINYFSMTTLLAVPFRNHKTFSFIYKALQTLDSVLFKIPYVGEQAWTVVITMSHPISD